MCSGEGSWVRNVGWLSFSAQNPNHTTPAFCLASQILGASVLLKKNLCHVSSVVMMARVPVGVSL